MVFSFLALYPDHILITNELFDELSNAYNYVTTIKMSNYFANGFAYDNCISDHYPVGIRRGLTQQLLTKKKINQAD